MYVCVQFNFLTVSTICRVLCICSCWHWLAESHMLLNSFICLRVHPLCFCPYSVYMYIPRVFVPTMCTCTTLMSLSLLCVHVHVHRHLLIGANLFYFLSSKIRMHWKCRTLAQVHEPSRVDTKLKLEAYNHSLQRDTNHKWTQSRNPSFYFCFVIHSFVKVRKLI